MKGLELIHEHHTMRALQTTSCASRTVVEQPGFISFPTAPLPCLPAQLSVSPEDLVLILLSAGKKRHGKGTLKDHSHLLHAVSTSLGKLGCLKHNRYIYLPDWARAKVHRARYPARIAANAGECKNGVSIP